jgi:hypothetical protein
MRSTTITASTLTASCAPPSICWADRALHRSDINAETGFNMVDQPSGPLAGVRVLELGNFIAAPTAGLSGVRQS